MVRWVLYFNWGRERLSMKLLRRHEKGQSTTEYAFVVAFIALAVIAVLVLLSPHLAAIFQAANIQLPLP